MSSLAVLAGLMQSRFRFLILTRGLVLSRPVGQELVWRNDVVGQVGLACPKARQS